MFKKVIVITAMMLVAGFASADVIGIFADDMGTDCTVEATPYLAFDIYVMAILTDTFAGGITAAEFAVPDFPVNAGYPVGLVGFEWTSDLLIGDIYTDFSIAWGAPVGAGAGLVLIGTINITPFDPMWLGVDNVVTVMPGDACDCLVTVDDIFEIHDAQGGMFWFNCTDEEACICLEETATAESSWSSVKALF
jgi:hypothetical protein